MLVNVICTKIDHIFGIESKARYCQEVLFPLLSLQRIIFCIIHRLFGNLKEVKISAKSDLHLNWDTISEYYNSILSIGNVISILNDNLCIIRLNDQNPDCSEQFTKFESQVASKRKEVINSILQVVTRYYYSILDHCIVTSYFTLDEGESFPLPSIKERITQGYEKMEEFYSELSRSIERSSFSKGLFSKILTEIDKEIKERVIRIHYNEVVIIIHSHCRKE